MEGQWSPLLPADLREQATRVVQTIARDIVTYHPPGDAIAVDDRTSAASRTSLLGGAAGFAVLFAFLEEASLFDGAEQLSAAYVNMCLAAAEVVPLPPMLYSGIAGIGWVIAHRRSRGWDDARGLASVTTRLARSVREDCSPATHFDLLTGVAGYGVLALEARGIGGDDELADAVLAWLVARMDEGTPGRWWTTPVLMPHHERAVGQPPYVDLGVAHGVPGTLTALHDVATVRAPSGELASVVDTGIEWILGTRLAAHDASTFPSRFGPETRPAPCRAAWCYGDPGVAATLYRVCVASERLQSRTCELAELAARALSREPSQAGVRDPSLCHGAAGLAHIAGRMFSLTSEGRFEDLADKWFRWVLSGCGDGPYAGLQIWRGNAYGAHPGFLFGATGVALALAAGLDSTEPTWDRLLLLSSASAMVAPEFA